jgi:hypothetical protein
MHRLLKAISLKIFKNSVPGCWWLTHIILATPQAEIRRIMIQVLP